MILHITDVEREINHKATKKTMKKTEYKYLNTQPTNKEDRKPFTFHLAYTLEAAVLTRWLGEIAILNGINATEIKEEAEDIFIKYGEIGLKDVIAGFIIDGQSQAKRKGVEFLIGEYEYMNANGEWVSTKDLLPQLNHNNLIPIPKS